MIHIIGYSALALNLFSMTQKDMVYLRVLSLLANGIYIVYGVLLNAPPFIIGCSIAVLIHAYRLHSIYQNKKLEKRSVI